MNYDREILYVLNEAGEKGLSVKKIARHVFNKCNNFFDNVSFDEVHHYVASYLARNSRQKVSVVEKTELRGVYRLSMSPDDSRQLLFDFSDDAGNKEDGNTKTEDKSLTLF